VELEFWFSETISNASEEDILRSIGREESVILVSGPETYIQCVMQEPPFEFILEYQDGSFEQHYEAVDRPIPLHRVIAAFIKYVHNDDSWKFDFTWKKMDI
jgi:hypothetical protein